jgi:hypothetical protein
VASKEYWEKIQDRIARDNRTSFDFVSGERNSPNSGNSMMVCNEFIERYLTNSLSGMESLLDQSLTFYWEYIESNCPKEKNSEDIVNYISLCEDISLLSWFKGRQYDRKIHQTLARLNSYLPRSESGPWSYTSDLLLEVEAGRYSEAIELYKKIEKGGIPIPPENNRFAQNPRHVLYLHLVENQSGGLSEICEVSLNKLVNRATKWEKGVWPVTYLTISLLIRLIRACLSLSGKENGPYTVLKMAA